MKQLRSVYVIHIYKEANRCADAMVSLACDMEADYMIYEEPPAPLLQLISFDVNSYDSDYYSKYRLIIFCLNLY